MNYNLTVRPLEFHRHLVELLGSVDDVEYPRFEADRLIEHLFGLSISGYWLLDRIELSGIQHTETERIVRDRRKGIPLAYSIGYAHFNGLRIDVNPSVLIPRQETEGLALIGKEVLRNRSDREELRILDFGTGSGCIAIWLALELPFSLVWATDISARAIDIANSNIKKYGLTMRVVTLKYDGLEGIIGPGSLDLLISNPPYIETDDARLDRSVRLYEPREALIAPDEGLYYYRHIARWAPGFLVKDGYVAVEVGEGQAQTVARIFIASGANDIDIRRDVANIERYVIARY